MQRSEEIRLIESAARGDRGAAAALVDHLVADARATPFSIIPLCPYVRARYAKHPDWQDVMTVAPGEVPHIPAKGRS